VAGFLTGGALVALLGVRGALLIDALTFALSAALFAAMVRDRPLVSPPLRTEPLTWQVVEGVRLVFRTRELRALLGWGVLVAAVTIAPEGLAVAVADDLGGGSFAAGVLTAAVPAGFVLGCWVVLRLPLARRRRAFPWLVLLSCVCLALSPWLDQLWLVAAVWTLAGVGTSLSVVANAAFVQAVPAAMRGRAFGVAGTALMAVQGVVLLGAGSLADVVSARTAVAVLALAGLAVLVPVLLLRPHGRTPVSDVAQATGEGGRSCAG
jgi:hypothetical protein